MLLIGTQYINIIQKPIIENLVIQTCKNIFNLIHLTWF